MVFLKSHKHRGCQPPNKKTRERSRKLIHDVERAIESRPESAENDVKRPRKHAFRKRWTRDDLLHTVLPKKR